VPYVSDRPLDECPPESRGGDPNTPPATRHPQRATRLTALEPQRFRPERLNVHLDGRFAFGLSAAVADEAGLRVGQTLAPAEIERLQAQDRQRGALNRALNFLGYRPRSEQEIRANLERGGFEPPVIEAAVEQLRRLGYVSDAELARFWVESRQRHSPRGDRLLAQELRRKGVDAETIETAIEAAGTDDLDAAVRAGRRKARQLAALDPQTFRQRLGAFLARRGFDWETIKSAVAALRAEVEL